MDDPRLLEVLHLLDPGAGKKLWFGGPTSLGCLRGVTPQQAAWKPYPDRHSIWELTLHLGYWKYAVRRRLDGSPKGSFPRSPADWPKVPEPADGRSWKQDRDLLRSEQEQLLAAVRAFDPGRLDDQAPGSGTYRFVDLLFGAVTHDLHHVGQIQLLKRLYRAAQAEPG